MLAKKISKIILSVMAVALLAPQSIQTTAKNSSNITAQVVTSTGTTQNNMTDTEFQAQVATGTVTVDKNLTLTPAMIKAINDRVKTDTLDIKVSKDATIYVNQTSAEKTDATPTPGQTSKEGTSSTTTTTLSIDGNNKLTVWRGENKTGSLIVVENKPVTTTTPDAGDSGTGGSGGGNENGEDSSTEEKDESVKARQRILTLNADSSNNNDKEVNSANNNDKEVNSANNGEKNTQAGGDSSATTTTIPLSLDIKNVIFRNGESTDAAVAKSTTNNQSLTLTFTGNTLYGEGKIEASINDDVIIKTVNGSVSTESITLKGTFENKTTTTRNTTANSRVEVEIYDTTTGNPVGKATKAITTDGNFDITISADSTDTNTKVTLEPGKNYTLLLTVISKGNGQNFATSSFGATFTTIGAKVATSTSSLNATLNLVHGNITPTSVESTNGITFTDDTEKTVYPLKFDVSNQNSTSTVTFEEIKDRQTSSFELRSGLNSNTTYTWQLLDKNNDVIEEGFFTTGRPSTNLNITGNGSSTTTSSNSITSSDMSKSDITDVNASLYVGSSTLLNKIKNGKDFTTNFEGVTASLNGSRLELKGLVPDKEYKNLVISYLTDKGVQEKITVPTFKTKTATSKLRQFISDVYKYSLERTADERGFSYWETNISNRTITPQKFVLNLLSEKEFINKYSTTNAKIEALYRVIVNRSSDTAGLSYWTDRYNTLLGQGMSESNALAFVADNMVNEAEFITRVNSLGI